MHAFFILSPQLMTCAWFSCFFSRILFVSMVGEAHSLKVEKVLFQGKSDYQNVMVFQVILIFVLLFHPSRLQFVVCHRS